MKRANLVHKLNGFITLKDGKTLKIDDAYCAYNSNKIRTTYLKALLDVPKNYVKEYFTKGYFFRLIKDLILFTIVLFILVMFMVLVFNLPELADKLNNLY